MGAAILVDGLTKRYGDLVAVKGISFEVEEGEVLAMVGPNGAGKTTTVEILEGYRRRSSGTVEVLGMDPDTGGRRLRERVGIVLQETAIEPYLSVEEILRQRSYWYPHPANVDEVVALVGLEDKRGTRIRKLSGGQQRRLDLALALIGDPDLVFLDEPTTGFDPSARRTAWGIIRNLCSLGKTVLLTTHYLEEAQELADRVVVIARGSIVAEGPPESLGGRDHAAVQIRFEQPDGVEAPLSGTIEGKTVTITTVDPVRDLHLLTGWALDHSVDLVGLTVSRPSLEDIYLMLAGESELEEP
jgi:ABC-2 type transport system ATP-binding protein